MCMSIIIMCVLDFELFYVIITGGGDYESGPFSIRIPAGDISVGFNISIIDSINVFEANETFTLTIDPSSLPNRVYQQPNCMLTVTIVDDDGEPDSYILNFIINNM